MSDSPGSQTQIPAPAQDERLRVLRLMNSEIDQRHDREDDARSTVERKLTAIIGFLLIAIPFALSYGSGAWMVAVVISFSLSIVSALVSLWPREYVGVPKPQRLVDIYSDTNVEPLLEERMLAAIVATKNNAYDENAQRWRSKLRFARLCHHLLALGFVLSIVAVLVSDLGGGNNGRRSPGAGPTAAVVSTSSAGPGGGAYATTTSAP